MKRLAGVLVSVCLATSGAVALTAVSSQRAFAAAQTFTNSTPIAIPATGTEGKAGPYPSQIVVSGVVGLVTDVNVKLTGLTHTAVPDVDVLLVGPGGQGLSLLSDTPTTLNTDLCASDAAGVDLTFDDGASSGVNPDVPLATGTYKPTDNDGDCDVSGDPYPDAPAPTGTTLAQFNGVNPNGTWSLYVFDDLPSDVGSIASWSITFNVVSCTQTVTGNVGGNPSYSGPGSVCISGATFSGNVSVSGGKSVYITNSTMKNFNATDPGPVSICGSTTGNIKVSGATGFVLVGDPGDDGCAANSINGSVSLNSNSAGVELAHNQIANNVSVNGTTGAGPFPEDDRASIEANTLTGGNLACSGNSPPPSNHSQPNTVSGNRTGQCAGL